MWKETVVAEFKMPYQVCQFPAEMGSRHLRNTRQNITV
jgi:hypothetical protein